ncbi:hypothetical protein OA90_01645 [Labrenzia sp. OB1]|nr:hypothetical protein OA90_01645 [Labrenzia sp. OB1]
MGAVLATAPGLAVAETPPKDFDRNGDQFLSGGELVEFKEVLRTSPNAVDATRYELLEEKEKVYAASGLVPIGELSVDLERGSCDFEQRLFIRRTIIDLPLAECKGLRPKSDGAAFNITNDRKADTATVDINGGIGLVLLPARTFKPSREGSRTGFSLVDLAVSAFAEGEGAFETDKDDDGYLRGGLKVDWLFGGGALERLGVSTAGYYQSDLGLGSGGYGVQVTAVPQNSRYLLNASTRGAKDKIDFSFRAKGIFDAFHVDDAGQTALSKGDYAWFGGELGFEYVDRTVWENGIVLSSGVNGYWNAVDGEDAVLWVTGLDVLLDPARRVSFGFQYTRGTSRQNPVFQNIASLGFKLKF